MISGDVLCCEMILQKLLVSSKYILLCGMILQILDLQICAVLWDDSPDSC